MPLGRYRLKTSTLALLQHDGRQVARTVPAGAIVEIDVTPKGDKLVEVLWDGKKLMMFFEDMQSRAELTE